MIVDPDFFDHWKTRLFISALDNDERSGIYVLKLWAHCQLRRKWTFNNIDANALKAICRYPGKPETLEAAFIASHYLERADGVLCVRGWDEYNRQLVTCWNNGERRKGALPKHCLEQSHSVLSIPLLSTLGKDRGAGKGKPTLEEVRTYCNERAAQGKPRVDPEQWFDYYEANGWKVGKNAMKDWKAAVRNWERNNHGTNGQRGNMGSPSRIRPATTTTSGPMQTPTDNGAAQGHSVATQTSERRPNRIVIETGNP